jgi:peptide subunit release factor 1 (eRF1)
MSTPIDTKTFNELPPLHKEVVTDFFKVLDKEDGNVIDNIETAVDKTADFHNVNTNVLYNYIDKEVDAQLGV